MESNSRTHRCCTGTYVHDSPRVLLFTPNNRPYTKRSSFAAFEHTNDKPIHPIQCRAVQAYCCNTAPCWRLNVACRYHCWRISAPFADTVLKPLTWKPASAAMYPDRRQTNSSRSGRSAVGRAAQDGEWLPKGIKGLGEGLYKYTGRTVWGVGLSGLEWTVHATAITRRDHRSS